MFSLRSLEWTARRRWMHLWMTSQGEQLKHRKMKIPSPWHSGHNFFRGMCLFFFVLGVVYFLEDPRFGGRVVSLSNLDEAIWLDSWGRKNLCNSIIDTKVYTSLDVYNILFEHPSSNINDQSTNLPFHVSPQKIKAEVRRQNGGCEPIIFHPLQIHWEQGKVE